MDTYTEINVRSAMKTGSRQEVEDAMMILFKEIIDLYREYNPQGNYLHFSFLEDDESRFFSLRNDSNGDDIHKPIKKMILEEKGDAAYEEIILDA